MDVAQTGAPTGAVAWPKHEWKLLFPVDRTMKLGEEIDVQSNFRLTRLQVFADAYADLVAAIEAGLG